MSQSTLSAQVAAAAEDEAYVRSLGALWLWYQEVRNCVEVNGIG